MTPLDQPIPFAVYPVEDPGNGRGEVYPLAIGE
jgi:hypothetical protein